MLEIAMYAVVAVFVISKLYNVLGKSPSVVTVAPIIQKKSVIIEEDVERKNYPQFDSVIRDILNKKPDFSLTNFINGAEKAFELIINAINSNDIKSVEPFIAKDLYKTLKQEIDSRMSKNKLHQTTLVSIKVKEIQLIELVKNNINITIKFVSDKVKLIRDMKTNAVTKGDASLTVVEEDVWSFTHNVRSNKKQWVLKAV